MKTKWRVRYNKDGYFYIEKKETGLFNFFPKWQYIYISDTKERAISLIQKLKNDIVYQE
jgi:hypothetical protein